MNLMQRVQTNLDKLVPEAPETSGAAPAPAHKRVQQMHGEKS
jgi:hypothetical protein